MPSSILAGDVGGTKTWLGLYAGGAARPRPVDARRYATADFDTLEAVVRTFLDDVRPAAPVRRAAFGVAGPVADNASDLTNVPWRVEGARLARDLGIDAALVLNDVAALACALPHLTADEVKTLHPGAPRPDGHRAVLAPGTHLGEACLIRHGGRVVPLASEGGHADFPARTPRELALVGSLLPEAGRVGRGDILSGPGLLRLHRFTHAGTRCGAAAAGAPVRDAATVTTAALDRRCPGCVEALELWVSALGAACGDLALRTLATGGVFIGGGIAPRIVAALEAPGFLDAFRDKGAMRALVERIPVAVILEPRAALLGAAVAAAGLDA